MNREMDPEKESYMKELVDKLLKLEEGRDKLLKVPFEIGGVERTATRKPERLGEEEQKKLTEINQQEEEVKKELGSLGLSEIEIKEESLGKKVENLRFRFGEFTVKKNLPEGTYFLDSKRPGKLFFTTESLEGEKPTDGEMEKILNEVPLSPEDHKECEKIFAEMTIIKSQLEDLKQGELPKKEPEKTRFERILEGMEKRGEIGKKEE